MAKGLSPTQRTMNALRNEGIPCAVAEKWVATNYSGAKGPGFRKDLFGFIDVVALDPFEGIIAVQCCAGSATASHASKIAIDCREMAEAWIAAGGKIQLWAWRKVKLKRGGKAMRWRPRIVRIDLVALDRFDPEEYQEDEDESGTD